MGKVKGKAKSGPKGGAKRHISKVKRSNQRQNKLVKQGKARPNSKPRYVANQRKGEKQANGERDIREEQLQWAKKKDEDHEEALQQLADSVSVKDAAFLNIVMARKERKANNDHNEVQSGDESDDEGLGALERGAVERIQKERDSEKKVKGLLPIKTKDGVKQRVEEVEYSDADEEQEENDEESGLGMEDSGEEEEEEEVMEEKEVSVVELYARRKELLAERKVHIGSLASNFLEAPQERMVNLEKLVKLVDSDQPVVIELTVHRLAAASVLEILKDVTPGFKITHQESRPNEKLKKDTLKLQKYESALLKCYKNYLLKLEKLVNQIKGRQVLSGPSKAQAQFFLTCMCSLLTAHPHFNFATNILHAVIPILSNSDSDARKVVKASLEEVFRGNVLLFLIKVFSFFSPFHNILFVCLDVFLQIDILNYFFKET